MHGVDIVQDDDLLYIEPNSVIKKGLFVPQAGRRLWRSCKNLC